MNAFIDDNMAVIRRRWPMLASHLERIEAIAVERVELVEGLDSTLRIDGVQLTSRHGRQSEAQLQAKALPADCHEATLYGTGLGDLQAVLLASEQLTQLEVYILNAALLKLVLSLLDQRHWLNDERVRLHLADNQADITVPFAVYPAELVLVAETQAKVRDRIVAELEVPYVNGLQAQQQPKMNAILANNQAFFRDDKDVAALFSQQTRRVWIAAPGPSLAKHYATLQSELNRDCLIALDTAVKPLTEQGITPDIVVTLDMEITPAILPGCACPLVYFPFTNTELLASWPGPRYLALTGSPQFAALRNNLGYASLYSDGSVIHPALDLAVNMGAEEVVLFGADFAFSGQQTHAGWADGALGLGANDTQEWTINGRGERVATLRNLRGYLCGVERFIAEHEQVTFYNTSRDGALITGAVFHPAFTEAS